MSRTLVKPRISVFLASSAATRLMKPTSAVSSTVSGRDASIACQWASMRPGIRTRPPQSTIRAPAPSGASSGSTASIVLPSTTTFKPRSSVSDLPSKSRALLNAIRETGVEALAAVLPEPAANTPGRHRRMAGEFSRKMRVQPRKRRRVAETPCPPRRFPIIRRAQKHSLFPGSASMRRRRALKARLCRTGGPPQSDQGRAGARRETVYAGVGASARINFSCLSSAQKSAGIGWRKAATFFST